MAKGKVIVRVEGIDGQIELMADRVVIYRKGLWNAFTYGMNAKREIPLGAISEVAMKDAGKLFPGAIEFIRSGQQVEKKGNKNLNAVKFNRNQSSAFEALKEKAFELMHQQARRN